MSSRGAVRPVDPVRDEKRARKPPDHTSTGTVWRDHLIMLLHIAAATEHALMVQYLYAAYSLDMAQEQEKRREMVARWQRSILAIAKEEMGHLLTVQNVLTLLGGPINLEREDFPWDAPYYPFPFRLEPLTVQSLACYVFAEMPGKEEFKESGVMKDPRYRQFRKHEEAAIRKRVEAAVWKGVRRGTVEGHTVGALYKEIIDIIEDPTRGPGKGEPKRIPDSAFQEATFSLQASWDDWGRGYQPDPRMLDAHGDLIKSDRPRREAIDPLPLASAREAHVMIDQVATRTQVVAALRRIGGQGEAPHLEADETGEPSHFERFLEIYQDFEKVRGWKPSRNVAVNPSTRPPHDGGMGAYIDNRDTRCWADLFNLRYRMLLTYLAHTFRLARVTRADEPSVRAVVMHKAFGEMYNLKTIAGILVGLPLGTETGNGATRAGPPFEIPYSLRLPHGPDAWLLHRDLLTAAKQLCDRLLFLSRMGSDQYLYLLTLKDLDEQSLVWINRIMPGARLH